MSLDLYYLEETDSICSNRVIVALAEKGITDWTPHKMLLVNRDQFKPEYLKLNPQGVVPTLVHDGRPIRESSLICDYIDDLRPDPALKPGDPIERYHMKEWVKLFDETRLRGHRRGQFRHEIPADRPPWKSWRNAGNMCRTSIASTVSNR